MKKVLLLSALFFLFFSCSEESNVKDQESNFIKNNPQVVLARYACSPEVIDINSGQNFLSGNITIGNNSDMLYVTYNANPNWFFKELHLYVGPLNQVPQSNGNPKPGQFPYKIKFNNLTSTYTFEIPLTNIVKDVNGCFVVAAHSSTVKTSANGGIIQTETGWAGYNDFSGSNWAKYFNYCLCSISVAE